MGRKNPDTSIQAFDELTVEMLHGHWKKIIDALSALGTANYERIADFAFMDRHATGRRMLELEKKELVYKPGTKSKTKSGRNAYDYCLTGKGFPTVQENTKNILDKATPVPESKYKQATFF